MSEATPLLSTSDMFQACLLYVDIISSNLNKPLLDSEAYPPMDETELQNGITSDYLDRCVDYWRKKGLIPDEMVKSLNRDDCHNDSSDPFIQRIVRSIAYSLQNPKSPYENGVRSPAISLERFIDAYVASRGGKSKYLPFYTFCIVSTEEPDIPDHVGHSAWLSRARRQAEPEETELEKIYRRALAFREWNGQCPLYTGHETKFPPDQCAEIIALPYILNLAREYIGNGYKTITISSLTMTVKKARTAFCPNCQAYVVNAIEGFPGLRIVDVASGIIYESDATREMLMNA